MVATFNELLIQVELAIKALNVISAAGLKVSGDYSQEKHALKKELDSLEKSISEIRNSSLKNPISIQKLADRQLDLLKEMEALEELEDKVNAMGSVCVELIKRMDFDIASVTKLSRHDMKSISFYYQLTLPSSLNKSREWLAIQIASISTEAFARLVNAHFKLTGYKRFDVVDMKVKSAYIEDFCSLLNQWLEKKQFNLLVEIIREKFGNKNQQICPMQIIEAILFKFNKRISA